MFYSRPQLERLESCLWWKRSRGLYVKPMFTIDVWCIRIIMCVRVNSFRCSYQVQLVNRHVLFSIRRLQYFRTTLVIKTVNLSYKFSFFPERFLNFYRINSKLVKKYCCHLKLLENISSYCLIYIQTVINVWTSPHCTSLSVDSY